MTIERRDPFARDTRQAAGEAARAEPIVATGGVFVVPDLPSGRLSPPDLAALGAGRALADLLDRPLVALCFGAVSPAELGRRGVQALLPVEAPHAAEPIARAAALGALLDALVPAALLLPDAPRGLGAEAGRRLAAARGLTVNAAVIGFEGADAVCATADPGQDALLPRGEVVLASVGFLPPLRVVPRQVALLDPVALPGIVAGGGVLVRPPAGAVPVAEAGLILAGGAGVRDWALLHEVAVRLGATMAGSRVVVDAGILPRAAQVGASGETAQAAVYLAFGISGAVQHLEGIARCGRVVSVNVDAGCAMASRADLALVADAGEVLRALLDVAGRDAA